MDIKKLHQAIKDLRAELDRVNLAIQRIETLAKTAGNAPQSGGNSSGEGAESNEISGDRN